MFKKITLSFFCSLLCAAQSQAQYCTENPSNGSTFDWTASSWDVWIRPVVTQAAQLNKVYSPFHPGNSLSQPNTQHLETGLGLGDYHPDDGWVLIDELMDFAPTSTAGVRFPQFVLYNRYESKLRYFIYLTDVVSANDVEVHVRFNNGLNGVTHVSAALEHAFTPMEAIANYQDKRISLTTPNGGFIAHGIWAMADIPIAYDPCTCQYTSGLDIEVETIKYTAFEFTLQGGGEIIQKIGQPEQPGQSNVKKSERFANALGGVAEGTSKGNSAYKATSELIGVTEKLLVNQANNKLTQEIRDALIAGGFSGNDLTLDDVKSLWNQQQSGTASQELLNATKHLFPKMVSSVVPDWIKNAIPFANTAFALLDFIVGGGKSTPPQPMHFNADFSFEGVGNTTDRQNQTGISFYMPGSLFDGQLSVGRQPVYNQVMGVLNLIEKPVLHRASQQTILGEGLQDMVSINEYSLKLAQPLRYALNPAAGLELSDIRASLQFRRCHLSIDYTDPDNEYYDIPRGLIDAGGGVWQTPYLPLSCLEQFSLQFLTAHAQGLGGYDQCEETYLHLTAKLKPPGSANETAFSALYYVDIQTAPYTFAQTPANPYLHIPNDLTVDRLEDVINGNLFSWNEITISQDVTVTQQINNFLSDKEPRGLIFVPGDPEAGTSGYVILEEIKEREIGSTIHAPFTVTNLPDCGTNDPVDAAWLAGFCADQSRYNPVLLIVADDPDEEEELPSYLRTPELPAPAPPARLLPNPAHDWAWLEYELPADGYISILVTDYLGRQALAVKQQEWQGAGAYRQAIPVGRLSAGLYYISLVQAEGAQTLKLLKE
jgi:hypothetical protein